MFVSGKEARDELKVLLQTSIEYRTKYERREHVEVEVLHANLPADEQPEAICQGTTGAGSHRRVIIATEVAETGVTVRGVRHVVDTGYYQRPTYHSLTGEQSLEEVFISPRQRAGRAAREGPGSVWRIYTENDYQGREPHSRAGASVDDLFMVHWRLRKMGVSTISELTAHLLDTPAFDSVCGALLKLSQMGLREKAGKTS